MALVVNPDLVVVVALVVNPDLARDLNLVVVVVLFLESYQHTARCNAAASLAKIGALIFGHGRTLDTDTLIPLAIMWALSI